MAERMLVAVVGFTVFTFGVTAGFWVVRKRAKGWRVVVLGSWGCFLVAMLVGYVAYRRRVAPSVLLQCTFTSGERLVIYYVPGPDPLSAVVGIGTLRYEIDTQSRLSAGTLGDPGSYDWVGDVLLRHSKRDDGSIYISVRGDRHGWAIHRDGLVVRQSAEDKPGG